MLELMRILFRILTWISIVVAVLLTGITVYVMKADDDDAGRKRGRSYIPGALIMIHFLVTALLLIGYYVNAFMR